MTKTKSTLSIALGSVFVASMAASSIAAAAQSPFQMASLDKGYMVAEADSKMKDGKCGEGKCGASSKAMSGGDKAKMKEASCGGDKAKMKDASCGADKAKMKTGSDKK